MKFKGEVLDDKVVVWDLEEARALYGMGFYGKPLGIPKPKPEEFSAPLVLDLMEAYYLVHKGLLRLKLKGRRFGARRLKKLCEERYFRFGIKYRVYSDLRDRGLVVTPGIKFGCDFAVYERGPGLEHAPYLVTVVGPEDWVTATWIVLTGRLATTVRKRFILAVVGDEINYISFEWWRA